jgi:hypothetical protein
LYDPYRTLAAAVFMLRVFQKKAKSGITYRRQDIEFKERLKTAEQFEIIKLPSARHEPRSPPAFFKAKTLS